MELNKILIGVVLTALVTTTFLVFISDGVTNYNPSSVPSDYNKSFVTIQKTFNEMNTTVSKTDTDATSIKGNTNIVSDFLGYFFSNGYQAIKTFIEGMRLTKDIAQEGVENTLGSSQMGNMWTATIFMLIIIVLISILLHFIIKSERL